LIESIVAVEKPKRIGRRALSLALAGLSSWRCVPIPPCRAILAGVEARASEVFVGRTRELEELERALDATRAGNGATVLVAGEAGIGKSRLASELGKLARDAGFEVLLGRSIDLVGTELPFQPFVEALRPLGEPRLLDEQTPGSQLRVFENTLALVTNRACAAPVMLVLEDLHWADSSTLDLVVFFSHNLDERPVLLLGTYRADEPDSAERTRSLAEGVRRSGSALVLELGPLQPDELTTLLEARADASLSAAEASTIIARSEGNPFFAEELLAAAGGSDGGLRGDLRDLLLRRVASLDQSTQGMLRLAAVAGRDVGYPLLQALAGVPEPGVRESLRQASGSFRFRHALLAEAVYATILPGEREDLHARLANALVRDGASAAELAPHWAAAGHDSQALVASVEAARQVEAAFGLAEAHAHLKRALTLWPAVPDAAELTGIDLAELCAWTGELAGLVGASTDAVELTRRAIELVDVQDARRAGLLHVQLAEYLFDIGSNNVAALAALERAVELVPADPPSPERAYALGSLAGGLMVAWRRAESLPIAEQALVLAQDVGAREAEVRALTVLGGDLAYLGRSEEGLAHFRQALQLADEIGDRLGLERAYGNFTDALTMLGRARESAQVAEAGLAAIRPYGIESNLLVSNLIEALLTIGDWDEAERLSAAALRRITSSLPYWLLTLRADVEVGRGDFDAARAHLEAASATLREDRVLGVYDGYLADLALWERRWTDADAAVQDGLAQARHREAAQIRVVLCAKGLRAHAELAALARARRDSRSLQGWLDHARTLIDIARNAAGEAEYERARGAAPPELWSEAARIWDRHDRPPLAAYCRWREAEALVAAGASRIEAGEPLQEAHAVAARIGAKPLLRELELLAQRARLDLASPDEESTDRTQGLNEILGLTPREAEVLMLLARGHTNREIAAALVISTKTASVHVSHILRKLNVPHRHDAAAIAHRLTPPHGEEDERES
jgi:DNA-binding CsgD family transcriptional regulator/tetratricopeptide (TPR) repeat protein